MNEHLKLAYDHGVQQAIIDAGLTKEAESPMGTEYLESVFAVPEGRLGSRIAHDLVGTVGGGALGAAGGAGLAAVLRALTKGKSRIPKMPMYNPVNRPPSLPHPLITLGGAGGALAGSLKGKEISQSKDDFFDRFEREYL